MVCMFAYCSSLTNLNLRSFNTSNVTSMKEMYSNGSGLTSLDLSSFETSKVTDMSSMYSNCSSLTNIYILKNIDSAFSFIGSAIEIINDN